MHTIKQRALWRTLWVAIGFYYFYSVAEVLTATDHPVDAVARHQITAVAVQHQITVVVVTHQTTVADATHQTMIAVVRQLPTIAAALR